MELSCRPTEKHSLHELHMMFFTSPLYANSHVGAVLNDRDRLSVCGNPKCGSNCCYHAYNLASVALKLLVGIAF